MEAAKSAWQKQFEEIKKGFLADFRPLAKGYVFYFVASYGDWITQNQIDAELEKYGYNKIDSFNLCVDLAHEGKFEITKEPTLAYKIKARESTHQ